MIGPHEALARLLAKATTLPSEEIAASGASGRILAEPILADRDYPPADRSAMDGFAVRAADCTTESTLLRVSGEIRAGQDASKVRVDPGTAVRIFTGAVMPDGADGVVMQESSDDDPAMGRVVIKEPPEPGHNVRRRGEDVRAGEAVLAPGTLLRDVEAAALASVGRTRVRVVRLPNVAVISTGDEIVDTAGAPDAYQIRNSNAPMLLAALRAIGVEGRDAGIVGDEAKALDAAIAEGLAGDVLLLTGGVSVGAYDLVEAALLRAGCEVLFHNVAMRPGKPALAAIASGTLVFGLPGNPVSAFTGFQVFVAPAVRAMMGHPRPVREALRAVLASPLPRRPGRVTYHIARLGMASGRPTVEPVVSRSSGDVFSLSRGNAFIVASGGAKPIGAGEEVDVLPWC